MKMNYRLKSRPKSGRPIKSIIAVSVFLLLSLFAFVFPNITRTISQAVAKPLWLMRGGAVNTFGGVRSFFTFKSTLIAENKTLENQVAMLEQKQIDYEAMQRENQDLKNMTGEAGGSRITARVLSKPPSSPYDTLIIDVGSSEGVTLGNKVYVSNSVAVGQVTSVTPHTSLVEMFSTSGRKQEASISRTGASFEIVGQGGANFKLEVPKDTDILWGDTFLYPTRSASVLGSVYYIDTNIQSSFKTVYIRIPGNIFSSQWVFVERSQ